MNKEIKKEKRIRRHKRVRAKIQGVKSQPRLCVFRSIKHIYAQLIDDQNNITLLTVSDLSLKDKKNKKNKQKIAFEVGGLVAEKAKEKGIEKVVFDRGGYKYHGRVKSLAEGARKGGLNF